MILTMKITREDADSSTDIEVDVIYDYEPALGVAVARECSMAGDPDHLLNLTDDEMETARDMAREEEGGE